MSIRRSASPLLLGSCRVGCLLHLDWPLPAYPGFGTLSGLPVMCVFLVISPVRLLPPLIPSRRFGVAFRFVHPLVPASALWCCRLGASDLAWMFVGLTPLVSFYPPCFRLGLSTLLRIRGFLLFDWTLLPFPGSGFRIPILPDGLTTPIGNTVPFTIWVLLGIPI